MPTPDGSFPRRKSKFLRMLKDYTATRSRGGSPDMDLKSLSMKMQSAKNDLKNIKKKLGYDKPKHELVVKKLSELVDTSKQMNEIKQKGVIKLKYSDTNTSSSSEGKSLHLVRFCNFSNPLLNLKFSVWEVVQEI